MAAALILTATSCQKSENPASVQSTSADSLRGGETRATLSPSSFTGPAAIAYQIAQEIPEVLDSLYCYCDCEKHFDHKSLLTCYVDEHALHCDVCMDEAFMAYELHKQGKDIKEIRKTVDEKFSRSHH